MAFELLEALAEVLRVGAGRQPQADALSVMVLSGTCSGLRRRAST